MVWPGKIPELDYQITDNTDTKYVDLVVPYLSYSQFQTTAVYKTGLSYYSFLDMLRHHIVGYGHDLARKAAAMCERMAKADAFLSGSEIGEGEHSQADSSVDKKEHDGEDGNSPGIPSQRETSATRRPYTIKVVQGQDDSDSDSDANSDSDTESDSYLPSDSEISSDNLCNGIALARTEFPVWIPSRSRRDSSTSTSETKQHDHHDYEIRHGLLNDIPGDSAIVHNGENISLNLVSSKWLEWRDFAVYPAVSSPNIQTSEGDNIKCHGYIMGTWTDTDTDTGILETRWSGLCFHIVDCVFGEEGDSDSETHNFLINSNLLSDENSTTCKLPPYLDLPPCLLVTLSSRLVLIHHMTVSGWDKKLLCARLNFCLFRFAPCWNMIMGSLWKPQRKKNEGTYLPTSTYLPTYRPPNCCNEYTVHLADLT